MSASPGATLGPYEIRSPLGAGGMGIVYRAHDKRLRRDVALKVLPPDLVRNESNQRRFAEEAQAASALNHPNIVSVFDVNLDSNPPYIVSELVEGATLREAMARRPMPLRKALDIAVQMADGMAAAHQAGIVHRDLKPQNIMVRPDGRVKILDFGLAKHLLDPSAPPDDQETVPMSQTAEGKVVGTVHYMSPEQARGKPVDTRSDIFSFGVILYEMVSGRRPFAGQSTIDALSALIRDDPAPIDVAIPVPLRWTIERCLAKDPTERYQSTRDLYSDLRTQRDHPELMSSATEAVTIARSARPARRWLPGILLTAGILAGFLLAAFLVRPGLPAIHANQFQPLATSEEMKDAAAWSPDGGSIAYQAEVDGRFQIFTRDLESASPLQVTHGASNCTNPAWSADGGRLFFTMARSIWSVGAAGGEPQLAVEGVDQFALSRDGKTLAFVRREYQPPSFHVWLSSPPGATPVRYSPAPFESADFNGIRLAFAPDGKRLLLWVSMQWVGRRSEFWLLPLSAGSKPRRVLESLVDSFVVRGFSWLPDSRRVVLACSVPPDVYRSHLQIAAVESDRIDPLVAGVNSEELPNVSRDGKRIAYTVAVRNYNIVEIPLDGSGVRDLLATSRNEYSPAWSPRAREFAYSTDRRGAEEIWVKTLERGWDKPVVTQRGIPKNGANYFDSPAFSPDGERVAFVGGTSIWITPVAGGTPVRLTDTEGSQEYAPTWSPDGSWIAFFSQSKQLSLVKARVGGRGPAVPLLETKGEYTFCVPDWSPKGDWIAFFADGATVLVSPDGQTVRVARKPAFRATAWSRDGATLYGLAVVEGGKQALLAVDVATGKEKRIAEIGPGVRIAAPWVPSLRLSLSPDGKALATTAVRRSADIWMLENFDKPAGLLAWLGWRGMFGVN